MTSLTAPALAVDPTFDYTRLLRGEGPVWQIVAERPMHLLDPKYKSWDDAILDTVDAVIAQLTDGGRSLADRTWGEASLNLLSFEADIWGRLRRATEAARANLLAAEENRKAVITTLVSDVAAGYFSLRDSELIRGRGASAAVACRLDGDRRDG